MLVARDPDKFEWAKNFVDDLSPMDQWALKQALAGDGRFYGDGGTIHNTHHLDVETFHGTVVGVWFRCTALPFHQTEVDGPRATSMESMIPNLPAITGVEVVEA